MRLCVAHVVELAQVARPDDRFRTGALRSLADRPGKVLYRDIASLFGPLSPYVNALWFKLFGVSLTTLIAFNLAILAAVVAGIHRLLHIATDRFTASVSTLAVLLFSVFLSTWTLVITISFALTRRGNTRNRAQCRHDHCASSRPGRASRIAVRRAGGFFGLLVLTKPETSLAACAAIFVGCVAVAFLGRDDRRNSARHSGVPDRRGDAPLVFAYFRMHMPTDDAWRAVAGASTTLATPIARNIFYLRSMGLDDTVGTPADAFVFAGFLALSQRL